MIIVKLTGGLGNQMFQYAAGRALAQLHHTELKLDKSYLEKDPKNAYTKREFELDIFSAPLNFVSAAETIKFLKHAENKIYRELYRRFPYLFKSIYAAENAHAYAANFKKYGPNAYLEGYWQSEKYFREIAGTIRKDFSFKAAPDEVNSKLLEKIDNCPSVSLHVRRGDYLTNAAEGTYHDACSTNYYKQAVELLSKNMESLQLFIFSDDIAWCKNSLSFNYPTIYINHNSGKASFEDMRLMSSCKHNIIANSSFSWWAAWLNKNENKQVIAPKNWFRKATNPDIYPENWIQL